MSSETSNRRYQYVTVSGTSFERGFQHGDQVGAKIRFNIEKYKIAPYMPSQEVMDRYIKQVYLPALESCYPRGLEEMKGIAEGAKVDLSEIIMLNARYDLLCVAGAQAKECTTMALINQFEDGREEAYVAQNWDLFEWLYQNDTIIVLHSNDPSADNVQTPRSVIALTEAGQSGRNGMNSLGMAVCGSSLWSSEDYFDPSFGPCLPQGMLSRIFLDRGTISEAVKVLKQAPRHTSNNLMLGSRSGIAFDFEITPKNIFAVHPQQISTEFGATRLVTHANHFTSSTVLGGGSVKDTYQGASSLYRDVRLYQRLEQQVRSKSGAIGVEGIKKAFTDHAGHPESICEHSSNNSSSVTLGCIIYDLTRLEMHIATGNPCQGRWDVYKLD